MRLTDLELMITGHLNLAEYGRELVRWSGEAGEIYESDGVLLFKSGSAFPAIVNGAQRLDPWVDAERLLDTADAWFAERERGYTIFVPQHEADLVAAVAARELPPAGGENPEMICEQPPEARQPPDGIRMEWVDDERGMRDFCDVNNDAYATYGMPPIFHDVARDVRRFCAPHVLTVVAYDGTVPLATAQVVLSHGIAGVYAVGTRPEGRNRGLGDAVARAVTREAFAHGALAVSLQASDMGRPIYARMGYRELYTYANALRLWR